LQCFFRTIWYWEWKMGVWGGGVAESTPRSSFEPLQSEHRVQYGPDNADNKTGAGCVQLVHAEIRVNSTRVFCCSRSTDLIEETLDRMRTFRMRPTYNIYTKKWVVLRK